MLIQHLIFTVKTHPWRFVGFLLLMVFFFCAILWVLLHGLTFLPR